MSYNLDSIVAWAKRKWFAYPGSDIYGWLANAWDLWPYWVEIKNNIEKVWWKFFVQRRPDVIWLDSQILMNPKVWEASGHVWWFSDPLVDCKKCKYRWRADQLIEEFIWKNKLTMDQIKERVDVESESVEAWSFEQQHEFLMKFEVKCPKCWACDWTAPKKFNLMFKTEQWVIEWEGKDIYLRPETAQWIFVNFRNVMDSNRVKIPFGIAQIGKAFRNEITPGNFMFRVREFYQMEIEFFVENNEEEWLKWLNERKNLSKTWRVDEVWIREENLSFREHDKDELSFYSKGTWDVEYKFPWWWGELQWIAYRTDYDLKQHMEHSSKDMQYSDPKTGKRYVPHCVEPSWGLTRAILTAMIDAYDEEKYVDQNGNEQTRVVAKFHKNIAPIKFAILPLIKKDEEQLKIAQDLFSKLSQDYMCEYDDAWAIGKRYRRQDEIWTPYCITVDQQSLEDGTVTIRDRDSMEQKRINIEDISL